MHRQLQAALETEQQSRALRRKTTAQAQQQKKQLFAAAALVTAQGVDASAEKRYVQVSLEAAAQAFGAASSGGTRVPSAAASVAGNARAHWRLLAELSWAQTLLWIVTWAQTRAVQVEET